MQPVYFFFHLAKTGGTTFIGNIAKYLEFDVELVEYGTAGDIHRKKHNRPDLPERSLHELNKVRMVTGHMVYWRHLAPFAERDKRPIIFLRDPIERIISYYNFNRSRQNESFMDWYASKCCPNNMYHVFADHFEEKDLSGILNKLKQFWHIGLMETLDSSIKQLYAEMGLPAIIERRRVAGQVDKPAIELPNQEGKHITILDKYIPTEDEIKFLQENHKLDTWLYEHIVRSLVNNQYRPEIEEFPPLEVLT